MIVGIVVAVGVALVFLVDCIYLGRTHRRALLLELLGFSIVVAVAVSPEGLTAIANSLGIGRGVDLIIYPMLVWLFREAVLGRVRYFRQKAEITRLVRSFAALTRKDL